MPGITIVQGDATEILPTLYLFAPGSVLHNSSFVGDTFRHSKQRRRRSERLMRRLGQLQPLELSAAVAGLAGTHPLATMAAAARVPE